MSIYTLAKKRKCLPTRIMRWCCQEYKENAGAGKVTLIGIRHEESLNRSKRNEVEISSRKFSGSLDSFGDYRKEQLEKKGINITNATEERTVGCINGKESILVSPIINWTAKDVWEFLNDVVRVPHCELYDQGKRRIGCLCCPMSTKKEKHDDIMRYPHVKRNWLKTIEWLMEHGSYDRFRTAEDVFNWWVSNQSVEKWMAENYQQLHFDFDNP